MSFLLVFTGLRSAAVAIASASNRAIHNELSFTLRSVHTCKLNSAGLALNFLRLPRAATRIAPTTCTGMLIQGSSPLRLSQRRVGCRRCTNMSAC